MKTPALLVALAGTALGLSYFARASEPTLPSMSTGLTAHPDKSCKPHGPIDVEFLQVHDYGDGSVQVELKMRPVLPMKMLNWRLELEPGMQLIEGQREGRVRMTESQQSAKRMRVSLPSGLTTGFGRLSVEVSGVFQGSDNLGNRWPERVVVQRTLSWGEPDSALASGTVYDAVLDEKLSLVNLPSVSTPGAGAVYKAGRK